MDWATPEQPALAAAGLALEQRGLALVLRLARPAVRNALNDAMIGAVELPLTTLPAGTCAVVVHEEGSHFCAGLDLNDVADTDATWGLAHSQRWHRAFARIEDGPVPVVSALHGAVIGGGLELAIACHIQVADGTAYYALPEGQRGIFVGGGAAVRLPRLIGLARIQDIMLTGRTYGAAEGAAVGFSQYLVGPGCRRRCGRRPYTWCGRGWRRLPTSTPPSPTGRGCAGRCWGRS